MAKKNKKGFSLFLNGKFDYVLFIVTIILVGVGLMMLLSASGPISISESGSSTKYLIRQGRVVAIGFVLMLILSKVDYRIYKKLIVPLYIFCVVVLAVVGLIGTEDNGARRWINIGGFFSLQPSEFVKVCLAIIYAYLLSYLREKGEIRKFVKGFLLPIVLFLPIALIMIKMQNHLSATVIMAVIMFVEMFVGGTQIVHFLVGAVCAMPIGALYYIKKTINAAANGEDVGFRIGRIKSWLDIESDVTGKGWQINQSLYAIGSGGLFGVGLGNSNQKYLYIPEPQNDFIFSVLAEETGFVGSILVIILFAIFVWRGIVISLKAEDTYGTLLAIGLTTMIGLQALINIAVVTNTIPVTGMPLPFFSYGGSAMLADLIAVGLLLSISRNGNKS